MFFNYFPPVQIIVNNTYQDIKNFQINEMHFERKRHKYHNFINIKQFLCHIGGYQYYLSQLKNFPHISY